MLNHRNCNVTLIWENGHTEERPFGSSIRSTVVDGKRYSDYSIRVKDLRAADFFDFIEWVNLLNAGIDRK